jgi:hypothetical protein
VDSSSGCTKSKSDDVALSPLSIVNFERSTTRNYKVWFFNYQLTERVETLLPYLSGSGALLLATLLGIPALTNAAESIDMSKVRALAALPVKEILRDSPVRELPRASYWKTIRESPIPVVVMFYSNVDPESQRLATLVRYVSIKYKDKISIYRVMVVAKGKPAKVIAADFMKSYDLDKTPGILFYDNDSGKMVLEDEQYIDANFKEFRTPSMLL